MAYENIKILHPNFCIGPQNGTYCSVNTAGSAAKMDVKSSAGALLTSYEFYPSTTLDVDADSGTNPYRKVVGLEYTGPKNQASFYSGLLFYTLEREINPSNPNWSTTAIIRRWTLNLSQSRLELDDTITKVGDFNCNAFAIEKTLMALTDDATDGDGYLDITTTSGLSRYDVVLIGPSSDTDNLNDIEYCYVYDIISPTRITVRSYSFGTPPIYQYIEGDAVTIIKNAFLFSAIGTSSDPYQGGRMYELEIDGGVVTNQNDSALYTDVIAARWSQTYGSITFVRGTNLLVQALDDYEISKTLYLNNIKSDKVTVFPVYDIDYNGDTIYRLQKETVKRDDNGIIASSTWSTYNYQEDTFVPYSANISIVIGHPYLPRGLISDSRIVTSDQEVAMTVTVRDQYGVSLINKNVTFAADGDQEAVIWVDASGITDSNGEVVASYTAGSTYNGPVNITAKADGSSTNIIGSVYVVVVAQLLRSSQFVGNTGNNFIIDPAEGANNVIIGATTDVDLKQQDVINTGGTELKTFSKFQFPGGDWAGLNPPTSTFDGMIRQKLQIFHSVDHIEEYDVDNDVQLNQLEETNNSAPIDQVYTSRHYTNYHQTSVSIDQFIFVQEARPVFWSSKNPVGTDIWLRLRPAATHLNLNTFKIEIREESYAGKEDWRDITSEGTLTPFDGGGEGGLEFQWYPTNNFHHGGTVYVRVEVFDSAGPPANIIILDYWFRITPDFQRPYIINEFPEREAYDISNDTHISFNIKDEGSGIDISTFEMYVDYKQVYPTIIKNDINDYEIIYAPSIGFNYGEEVGVQVVVCDTSGSANRLVDSWRFYIRDSSEPWFDKYHYKPGLCAEGLDRDFGKVSFQVYGQGDGIDYDSLKVVIGGKRRDVTITPVVYRLS